MGPTASGKTSLALEIAEHLPCEIISVDSVMVYRGLDIGTAKPSQQQRQLVSHHLIDICDPAISYSAAQFCDDAKKIIDEIIARERYPLLVGGTMLYFRALQQGLSNLPAANELVRNKIMIEAQRFGWSALHQRLQLIDPSSARRIQPHDQQRIQRALEVFEITGQTLTEHWQKSSNQKIMYPFTNIIVTPSQRDVLHQKIEQRFSHMLQLGLVDEVQTLFKRDDLNLTLPALRAVGYRQVWQYLEKQITYDEMRNHAITATRQYAKRQLTWFRGLKDVLWLDSLDSNLLTKCLAQLPFNEKP